MAKFKEGDEVILRATVTRAVDDDKIAVEVKGYSQAKLTIRDVFAEPAGAPQGKKRGMEGVLTRQ